MKEMEKELFRRKEESGKEFDRRKKEEKAVKITWFELIPPHL